MAPASCPGVYGFSIANNGKFKVGPAPNGNVIEGSLAADELTTLTSAVNDQLASGTKMSCLDVRAIPGSNQVITASFPEGAQVNLWTVGMVPGSAGGKCAFGDYQKAMLVDEIVSKLVAKYYPRPFPTP
jgi:hypothetical protein